MADRFYINTTNLVTFAAGERPTADKFNAVNRYFSRGLNSLARVIGDAHDDGAPHNLNTSIYLTNKWNRSGENERPLDILNLARIIGPASNLNPKYLNRTDHASRMIQETIPAGVLEYYPKFPIDSLGTIILGSEFVSEKGFIRFETNTTEEIQFQYIPKDAELIEGGPNYVDAEFNVIPDPNTPANDPTYSLTIVEEFDGSYTVALPTVGYQQSKLSDLADSNIDSAEPNNAAQIKLPKWMQDLGVLYNGSTLPEGTIYIKDRTTGESFIDAQYIYLSDTEVKVSGVELCLDEDHDFCLIVSGTDITTTLDDLRNKVFMHKHDGSFGESRISIYDLKDVFKYAPPSGAYKESELTWNAFPQYLHRDGWQEGEDSFNGENAMRGPLMMGILEDESYPIYFGSISNYIKAAGSKLLVESIDGEIEIKSAENAIRLNGNEVIINDDLVFNKKETEVVNYKNISWEIKRFSSEKNLNLLYKEEALEDLKIKLNYFGTRYPEYQSQPVSTSIPELDSNILIVDALNSYYNEVDDGNGFLFWSFNNFDSTDFINDHLTIDGNLLLEDLNVEGFGGNATSLTFKLVANSLKANYILELWDRIVWPDNGDPEDGTPVFYEMLLKKPWNNGNNYEGSYRFLSVEIDRGLPWYTHVLEVEDFSKEKTYKSNFAYSLNAFPYYHYGFNGKRFPMNYIILNYEIGFINNKINKIDCSLLNGIKSFVTANNPNLSVDIILKVEEIQNVKIKISMDKYISDTEIIDESNHGSKYYEDAGGKTFGGILKLIVEETLIDGILFLEAKAIVLGSTFYYRKFLPVSEL
jgi:hypothetical protein